MLNNGDIFRDIFLKNSWGTPTPSRGTELYAVHIAFVGGGGGYIMQLKSPKWARNQTQTHKARVQLVKL